MDKLEAELRDARALDVEVLADAVQAIGFECTRCGGCCKGHDEGHVATVFPDEIRAIQGREGYDWRDVARPVPFGLGTDGEGDPEGETFEWALASDECGDCTFYEEAEGSGACTVYGDRPLICRTYPFSVELGGSEPMGEVTAREGPVRAHECEGLGADIDRPDAMELARTLKERAVRELEEMIAVRDRYEPVETAGGVVVHDSEGAKQPDGSRVE